DAEAAINLQNHAQVFVDDVLDQQLAASDGGDGNEAADFKVIRPNAMPPAAQSAHALDVQDVGADAFDLGPHLHEHAAKPLHVGFAGGVAQDGLALGQHGGADGVLGGGDG